MSVTSILVLSQVVLLGLFLLTAAAVTGRPWRISEGWWPVAAVVVALLVGAIPATTAVRGLGSSLDVLAFFAGLLLLAWTLRVTGSLTQLLDRMEQWAADDPRRMLAAVAVATVAGTALLSNDAAALLLAPAVLDRIQRRGLALTPFVLTMAFTANAASALLPISNPVNLLILDRSQIALSSYLTTVTPAAVLGVLITVVGCLLVNGRGLARGVAVDLGGPPPQSAHRPPVGWIAALTGLLVLTDVGFAVVRLPIGPPTLVAGALATLLVRSSDRPWKSQQGIGWSILALVAGFSVLAAGLGDSSWLAAATERFTGSASTWMAGLSTGLVTAAISSVINNLPAALLVTSGLQAAHHLGILALAAIVGADLGPNLAPFGSLSTILILGAVRSRGQPVPWARVWRLGLVVGPVALVPTVVLVALSR
ncbi:MAG TPA: SLC13 family permease [Candidatus Dormibacteraeota bacterium]|nr:SLC13 family permease [Candidatus Dormibacteraeota bacterium]